MLFLAAVKGVARLMINALLDIYNGTYNGEVKGGVLMKAKSQYRIWNKKWTGERMNAKHSYIEMNF